MPEVPKIVHDRLRAGLPEGTGQETAHPDPNQLTAFAEQALSTAERESVLQHLTACGDCREAVALSIPPMEGDSRPIAAPEDESTVSAGAISSRATRGQRSWFAWRSLRWAALAAVIAVAGGILLIHPGNPNSVREATQQSTNTVSTPKEQIIAKQQAPAPDSALDAIRLEKKSAPAVRSFGRDKESGLAHPAPPAERALIAQAQSESRTAFKDLASGKVVGVAPSGLAPQAPSTSEMAVVPAASGPVMAAEARNDLALTGTQVSDLKTISKAKAAKTESNAPPSPQPSEDLDKQQSATDTPARRQRAVANMNAVVANSRLTAGKSDFPQPAQYPAQWAIHGNDLQRSLNSGAAWKTVLHSDRALLCYGTGGNEVWVGGKTGDLFHSANGGVTWTQVHPSAQELTLAEDITSIDVYSPSQVVLFTGDSQSWSSADGGKTWEKK